MIDNIAPTALCSTIPINATLNANGQYIIDPNSLNGGSTDNFSVVTLTATPALLDCSNEGSNNVQLTVTDGSNNSSSCTATVEVATFLDIGNVITTPVSCAGAGDGAITILANAGGGQISYSVDGGANFQLTPTFNSLTPGIYNIVVKIFGLPGVCEKTATAVIAEGTSAQTWYKDMDNDGYSDGVTMNSCSQPAGYQPAVSLQGLDNDCNDNDPLVHPNQTWYEDLDNDGHSSGNWSNACNRPTGCYAASELSTTVGDCNDTDGAIYPGAAEICNGIDDDCDGEIDEGAPGGLVWTGNVLMDSQADVDAWQPCYTIINGDLMIMGTGIDSLLALRGITEVTGNVTIQSTSLDTLYGLDSLKAIGGSMTVYFNSILTSLKGLDSLAAVDINLMMYYNFQLTDACPIYNLVNGGVGGSMTVYFNSIGANSVAEILTTCAPQSLFSNPNEQNTFSSEVTQNIFTEIESIPSFRVFPNPAYSHTTLEWDEPATSGIIKIVDIAGRAVYEKEIAGITERIDFDLDGWKAGTYFMQIKLEERKLVTKRLVVVDY